MDNSEKQKIHINPDFIAKIGEAQSQSRFHFNPAFFQKSAAPQPTAQSNEYSNSYYSSKPPSKNIYQFSGISTSMQTPALPRSLPDTQNNLKTSLPPTLKDQYNSSHSSHKSLMNGFSSSVNKQMSHSQTFGTSLPIDSTSLKTSCSIYTQAQEYQKSLPMLKQESLSMSNTTSMNMSKSNVSPSKPSIYSWKASESSPKKSSIFSTASNTSRSLKYVDSAMSFNTSKFKYKSQDSLYNNKSFSLNHMAISNKSLLSSLNHMSNALGNKYKVDNRKNGQELGLNMKAGSKADHTQSPLKNINENAVSSIERKVLDIKDREQSAVTTLNINKSFSETNENEEKAILPTHKSVDDILNVAGLTFLPSAKNRETKNDIENVNRSIVESQNIVPKYKLLSRTKLIRRRSRSLSSDKMKVNIGREKLFAEGYAGHPKSVAIYCPSSKFPSRSYQFGRVHPKRKFAVLSRTKLVRRQSSSSNMSEDLTDVPKYSIKTKTKLVKKPDSLKKGLKGAVATDEGLLKEYAVLSSTKLVRQNLNNVMKTYMPKIQYVADQDPEVIIRRHNFVQNTNFKAAVQQENESFDSKSLEYINTKYKLENKGMALSAKQKAAKGIVSKYKINRLKTDMPLVKKHDFSGGSISKYKINRLKKAELSTSKKKRFVEGVSMYKINRNVTDMLAINRQKAARGIVNTKYKLENRGMALSAKQKVAKGIVSKYKINRLKTDMPIVKKQDFRRGSLSKYRIKMRFVEGISKYKINRNVTDMSAIMRQRAAKGIVSKYRINRLKAELPLTPRQRAARGIVSKYRIDRLKPIETSALKKRRSGRFKWVSSKDKLQNSHQNMKRTHRSSEKFSDRFINIGGILYKATQTSLRKHQTRKNHMQKNTEGSKCIVKLHGQEYNLSAGGKTLTRILSSPSSLPGPSLSRVHIGGLTYSRTKSGQYELTKAHQVRAVVSSAKQRSVVTLTQMRKRGTLQKRNQYCIFFNRFGRCAKKNRGDCPFLHDTKRVAVCTRFLRGRCPVDICPFSHEIDPNKMPVCSHFVRSTCNRENCPYRHVKVNPSAPLCLDFLHGSCLLGEECKKQHVLECEEFSESGKCPRGESCPLSHRKGVRKSRKSVSLEPLSSPNSKFIKGLLPRNRKISEPMDVLGAPVIKKEKPKYKKYIVKPKRYFQVSSLDDEGQELSSDTNEKLLGNPERMSDNGKDFLSTENLSGSPPSLIKEKPDNEKDIKKGCGSGDHKSAVNFEKVRERVLLKVEKLKQAYIFQETQDLQLNKSLNKTGNSCGIPERNKDNKKVEVELKDCINDIKETKECVNMIKPERLIFNTYERKPLPKRLPSYIPLSTDNDEVEDL